MAAGLQIEQDPQFQRKMWKFQRAGMIFFAIFFLSALTGLFGSGPLSFRKEKGDALSIEYPYLTRYSHHEVIKLNFGNINEDTIKLLVNRDYISNLNIEGIEPQPVEQIIYKNFIQFNFLFNEEQGKNILFNLQFRKSGLLKGEWAVKGRGVLHINHIVFP